MKKTLLRSLGVVLGTSVTVTILSIEEVKAIVPLPKDSSATTATTVPLIKQKSADNSFLVAQSSSLNGVWNCNDGGVYFVRQMGNEVWWYGQSSDGGTTWSNVFHGVMRGNQIDGRWVDVPKGSVRGYGEMTLAILNNGRIEKVMGGQNFGGSSWRR